MDEKRRLAWFILLRMAVVSLFLISTIILNAREPGSITDAELTGFYKLIFTTYVFSAASLLVLRFTDRLRRFLTYAQIIWDLILVTLLILLTGGVNSPYSFLYMLSIVNASVLLARREAIYTASLCAILYGGIIDLQYYGKLEIIGLLAFSLQQYSISFILYTIFINILAFYLTAFLTGYLAERVRKTESALQEKAVDYEELERLNSSIVSNIDSGLLTINNELRVRVFNRHASDLIGVSQEEAYDRPISEIFKGFAPYGKKILYFQEGEIEHNSVSRGRMIFGFRSVPFTDKDGNRVGVIINFKDLTQLIKMKAELKKADRLAAIGELSAHIAHEVKNPLASISGSVQLICQGGEVSSADRKLLDIIERETERLNVLINDFLAYARPTQPTKIPLTLRQLISDLESLLAVDPRFSNVSISNRCPEKLTVSVDHDQMRQVFWNLFLNAAEAMPMGGTITIDVVRKVVDSYGNGMVNITIADTGKGMDRDDMKRVFEPFFTTKSNGTGLGLATVYRIIEAHGGAIFVDSVLNVGTTFTISLPVE
jgi:two-component system sensor histidine kinase PilS (NtrC family)